ncbi:MAG TPA: methyltransferase domain-containing protein [Herpetosiphonaceae bacterium]
MLIRIKNTLHAPDRWSRIRDFLLATLLFRLPVGLRKRVFGGEQHYCPLCRSSVRRFLALHRPYHAWCPICRSLQRHRWVWLCLQTQADLLRSERRRLLHIAPEPALAAKFKALPHIEYVSADLYDPQAMITMDLCAIPAAASSFDLVYCSHVLEHVPDDRQAMRELYRVLASTGQAIILVPIFGEQTFEDPSITDPIEREKLFGQHDHVRRYGHDFSDRLAEAGFDVFSIRPEDLVSAAEIERMGLSHGEAIFFCRR